MSDTIEVVKELVKILKTAADAPIAKEVIKLQLVSMWWSVYGHIAIDIVLVLVLIYIYPFSEWIRII